MKTIIVPKGREQELICESLEDLEIVLEENSKLKVISIQDSNVVSKIKRSSSIGKNASIKWIDYWLSGSVNLTSEDNLNGRNAKAKRIGIFFGSGKQQFKSNITVNHNAPETYSNLLTRGVLDGKARANNKDTIIVKNGSKKANGKQKSNILLLSDDAYANASPHLEIGEEDVNCSHGAAIGRINSSKLFYLASRGLTIKEAKREIVKAFFEPALKEIRDENIVCGLRGTVSNKVGGIK